MGNENCSSPNEVEIVFNGPSKGANDLLAIEALLRGLKSFDTDIDFKDGKAPKKITKRWFLPLNKIKAKLNPGPKKQKRKQNTKFLKKRLNYTENSTMQNQMKS